MRTYIFPGPSDTCQIQTIRTQYSWDRSQYHYIDCYRNINIIIQNFSVVKIADQSRIIKMATVIFCACKTTDVTRMYYNVAIVITRITHVMCTAFMCVCSMQYEVYTHHIHKMIGNESNQLTSLLFT